MRVSPGGEALPRMGVFDELGVRGSAHLARDLGTARASANARRAFGMHASIWTADGFA